MIIGICGGSGSGKSTLQRRLSTRFKELKPTVFTLDNYYRPIQEQFRDENGEVNFDLPTALDTDRLFADFEKLTNGETIEVIEYKFNTPDKEDVLLTIEPSSFIVVEGLFIFHYPEIRERLDFSIFVDLDIDIQLDRRIYRDQELRGYSREAIIYQWENHVLPCFAQYLEPYKETSDFIFINNQMADEEFIRLIDTLKQHKKFKQLVEVH